MKNRIENLLIQVGGLMQRHLSKSEFESVTRLSTLLARLQLLQKRAFELDGEITEIESTVKGLSGMNATQRIAEIAPVVGHSNGDSPSEGRVRPQTLRIEIDWRANGKDREREIIFGPKAADCMTKFFRRVVDEFGEDALQKLRRIQVNRGPLLSEKPQTDFLNQAQGNSTPIKLSQGLIVTS